jgi:hypothetical protein
MPVNANSQGREFVGGGQSVGEVVTGWVGKSATVYEGAYTCSRKTGTRKNASFNRFA